jgi:hypothetical protein
MSFFSIMKKTLVITIFILIVVTAIQEYRIKRLQFVGEKARVIHDTITIDAPAPVLVMTTGQITAKLPVARQAVSKPEKVPETAGNAAVEQSLTSDVSVRSDSATVIVPISTKVYEDSLYRAVISGYNASLDSITVYRQTVHVEHFADVGKMIKQSRWSVGVQIGYGTDFRCVRPYIGVGIGYRLFDF